MMHIEQKHKPVTFTRCRGCSIEPKHVMVHGRHSREPLTLGETKPRHMIECCRCNRNTGLHVSLDAASSDWGNNHAQESLPLRVVRRAACA